MASTFLIQLQSLDAIGQGLSEENSEWKYINPLQKIQFKENPMRSLMITLGILVFLSACASKKEIAPIKPVDSSISIQEEVIVNPNQEAKSEEKKKIVMHHDGISVVDVMDFAFELYEDSEIAEEQMKVHNEKLKENLPPGSRVNNP